MRIILGVGFLLYGIFVIAVSMFCDYHFIGRLPGVWNILIQPLYPTALYFAGITFIYGKVTFDTWWHSTGIYITLLVLMYAYA